MRHFLKKGHLAGESNSLTLPLSRTMTLSMPRTDLTRWVMVSTVASRNTTSLTPRSTRASIEGFRQDVASSRISSLESSAKRGKSFFLL